MRTPEELAEGIRILQRTPAVLQAWLGGLPEHIVRSNEGPETWSAYDVIGHLIHGEHTDWIPRMQIILEYGQNRPFVPFDRFAQFTASQGKSLEDLLREFSRLRAANMRELQMIAFTPEALARKGRHPELGTVTLGELFAAWVVHDLTHIHQIARVMAKQFEVQIGPWVKYMGVLSRG